MIIIVYNRRWIYIYLGKIVGMCIVLEIEPVSKQILLF